MSPDGQSVYVVDSGNHRIQKFTSEGVFVSKWGMTGTGDGLFWIRGVAVAPDGSVYVADPVNHRGQKFTSTNFCTHDSTPETLMPEGNKSRVSGVGVESNYTENAD